MARWWVVAGVAASLTRVVPASTEEPNARTLYQQALALASAGEFADAARRFAEADALEPNDVALTSALIATLEGDDPVFAMELVDRAAEREAAPSPPETADFKDAARRVSMRFAGEVGRLLIRCAKPCHPVVGAESWPADEARWIRAGVHDVVTTYDGRTVREQAVVRAGELVEVSLTPLPAPTAAASLSEVELNRVLAPQSSGGEPSEGGISPAWFWTGAALTAALAGGTIASGVDTLARHDAFQRGLEDADGGQAAQLRTNALLFTTIGVAVATAAVGVFAVDWTDDAPTAVQAGPTGLRVRTRF